MSFVMGVIFFVQLTVGSRMNISFILAVHC